jgi:hypothetical protein
MQGPDLHQAQEQQVSLSYSVASLVKRTGLCNAPVEHTQPFIFMFLEAGQAGHAGPDLLPYLLCRWWRQRRSYAQPWRQVGALGQLHMPVSCSYTAACYVQEELLDYEHNTPVCQPTNQTQGVNPRVPP